MGFFKKIGKAIKKGFKGVGKFVKKNVSFKNFVKLGGMIDPTGIVGGLQEAHYAKKAEKEALAQQQAEEAAYYAELARQKGEQVGQSAMNFVLNRSVLRSVMDGATQKGGTYVAEQGIKGFFKKHWLKVVGGVVGLFVLIFLFVRMGRGSLNGKRRR